MFDFIISEAEIVQKYSGNNNTTILYIVLPCHKVVNSKAVVTVPLSCCLLPYFQNQILIENRHLFFIIQWHLMLPLRGYPVGWCLVWQQWDYWMTN